MKRYAAAYSSLVLGLFLLACASCRPLMSSMISQSCAEASSARATATLSDPAPDGWARYSPVGLNLSIALPGEPHTRPIQMPENLQHTAWKASSYSYNDEHMFAFLICNTRKDGSANPKSLKEFTEGFVNGYKKSSTYTNLQFAAESETPCRMTLKGSYRQNNRDVELEGFSQAKDSNVWIILFSHVRESAEGKSFVKYAEESVRFD